MYVDRSQDSCYLLWRGDWSLEGSMRMTCGVLYIRIYKKFIKVCIYMQLMFIMLQ